MSVVGLFAGIGGFELAFKHAGFDTSMLVEIDPVARAVLRTRFPAAEMRSDVAALKAIPRGAEIIAAGFPCQNLSMAGDKTGIDGPKSGLVGEVLRLAERSRKPLVVIENVYFMLHLGRGRAMDWLLGRFEDLGYSWAYRVLDTSGFGLPQRRRRVYLVASRTADPRTIMYVDESEHTHSSAASVRRPIGFYWTEGRSGVGITVDGIPPLKGGSSLGIPSAPAVLFPDGAVLMPSLEACERLQGFPACWTEAADAERPRARWRLIGNAVSVPVAEWVASRIKNPGCVLDLPTYRLEPGSRWPDAAYNVGAGRFAIEASDKPISAKAPSISSFRDGSWTELSSRALAGFLDRANEGGLRFPPGFLKSLRRALLQSSAAA